MNCAVHPQSEAVAFCRTCGKALCENCQRDVMGAIYCEPCIAARLQGQVPISAAAPMPRPPVQSGAPNPTTAGLLGFIPGVGAMYNGQFMKAFAHVVIFVMLILAANTISGIFGVLIAFFVIYMAFEAYKTAEAHRMGLPAPDPLGLDKMFGIQESTGHHSTPAATMGAAQNPPAQAPMSAMPPPVQVAPPPASPRDNTPIGAIVLIGLGVLFLLSNFSMVDSERIWPLFLIGIGLWIAYKRINNPAQGGRP